MRHLLTACLLFLANISFGYAQEVLTYNSKWKDKPITLEAELHLPKTGKAPYPTIVTLHGSGPDIRLSAIDGKSDVRSIRLKEQALNMGFAVIVMDVFTKRNLYRVNEDPTQISSNVGAVDTKMLLRALSKDKRIDQNNVFFTGHSWGGMVAYSLMYGSKWKERDKIQLKGIVADAVSCNYIREDDVIKTSSLIVVGERDERTPVAHCFKFADMYKNSGKVTVHVIPNMDHSFSTAGSVWFANGAAANGCSTPIIVKANGTRLYQGKVLSDDDAKGLCMTKGTWTNGNQALLDHNVEIALNFIKSRLSK